MADTSAFPVMEEREETMVPPFGGDPFLRTAHFLKPTNTNPLPLSPLSKAQIFGVRETPLNVRFKSTSQPPNRWKYWVYKLLPKHQNIWKKAGIYDSILNSTYKIIKHDDLILALAERWCVETNTFVFPWGESTITLEDMIVLGGYSVLGDYISTPLSTNLMKEIEEKLMRTRNSIVSDLDYWVISHTRWMDHFIDSNNELEHVAFLALWFSRYVFNNGRGGGISSSVFPIAIHLSLGTRLAIAPTVLAMLYQDLSLLKKSIISNGANLKSENVYIWSPTQLVQIWAWERIPILRPSPNSIQVGEPRSARWHEQKHTNVDNSRKVLDSCGEDFQWRPYCMVVNNWKFNDFYRKNGELVSVELGMDEEVESFYLCIRPSELVGLGDFIEHYLPHRVAMQFGFDQDIPGSVPRFNESHESAWGYYKRPIGDEIFYIPPRLFESDVTSRYLAWWDPTMSAKNEKIDKIKECAFLDEKGLTVMSAKDDKIDQDNEECVFLEEDGLRTMSVKDDKIDKDKEECGFLDEDKLTIGELLGFSKKKIVVTEENCLMSNSSEDSAPLVLVNGACEDVGVVGEPIDIDTGLNVVKYKEEMNFMSSKISNDENEIPTDGNQGSPGRDLEARISKLERMVALLKAEYFGGNL